MANREIPLRKEVRYLGGSIGLRTHVESICGKEGQAVSTATAQTSCFQARGDFGRHGPTTSSSGTKQNKNKINNSTGFWWTQYSTVDALTVEQRINFSSGKRLE